MQSTPWKLVVLSPRVLILVPCAETSSAKNSQPLVSGNFWRGCLTITSPGRSCRNVPTGYSLSGTLFLKIRTASFSLSGSAFLMYVFLILVPSRMQPNDFSETVTSWAYTLHAMDKLSTIVKMALLHTKAEIRDRHVKTERM